MLCPVCDVSMQTRNYSFPLIHSYPFHPIGLCEVSSAGSSHISDVIKLLATYIDLKALHSFQRIAHTIKKVTIETLALAACAERGDGRGLHSAARLNP
jgi:hypothetical protein